MNIIRILGLIVSLFLVGFLVWSFFLPSEFYTENQKVINRNKEDVIEAIMDMNTWEYWQIPDSNITNKVFSRNGVMDSLVWTGQAGVSGMIVRDSIYNSSKGIDSIRFRYQYANQPDDYRYGIMEFNTVDSNNTKIIWTHRHDVGMNPIMRFALSSDAGISQWERSFDSTLVNFKEYIESRD
ncbi:MAG: hypothetical protein Kapaf2KO_06070 [Candidatus Kapaibacteriales bacterium]